MPGNARPRRIGILDTAPPDPVRAALWDLFRRRLHELGHAEGEAIGFEFRSAHGRSDRAAEAAAELVGLEIDVLVTAGTPAAEAGKRATRDIAIVMATGTALGATRADNVTGLTDLPPGLSAKRLELLRDAVPHASGFAILADHDNPSSPPAVREMHDAARSLAAPVRDYWVRGPGDFGGALAAMRADGIGSFVAAPGAMFFAERKTLAAIAIEHRLAAMTVTRRPARSCPMAPRSPTTTGAPPSTWTASCAARSRPSCRSGRRPRSSLS